MASEELVFVPFPKNLYDKVVARSAGQVDPVGVAVDQLEDWIERTLDGAKWWTEEGLEAWEAELEPTPSSGDPSKGYQWKTLLLPNGTTLRMTYQGRNHLAQIRYERLRYEGNDYSPSQFAGKVAGSSRNAWRDLWVKLPGSSDWQLADELRREKLRRFRDQLIRDLG
jgi:hypothetical protein